MTFLNLAGVLPASIVHFLSACQKPQNVPARQLANAFVTRINISDFYLRYQVSLISLDDPIK